MRVLPVRTEIEEAIEMAGIWLSDSDLSVQVRAMPSASR